MPTSPWMRLSSTCISWRSLRSSAPSGSSSSSTLRAVDDRAGERDALALAAGELGRRALLVAGQAHELERLGRAAAALLARDLGDLEAVLDVVADRHVREQRVVLEDRVDVARVGRQAGDVGAAQLDRAGVGDREAGDQPQRRRLARAGGAEQREELALGDVEVDAVDGGEVAVALGQAAQADVGQRAARVDGVARFDGAGCLAHSAASLMDTVKRPVGQSGRHTCPLWSDCSIPRRRSAPRSPPTGRWPRGCGRARWRSSWARSTCSARARRCAPRWSRASRTRWCSTGRPAPARRRWRGSRPSTPPPRSRSSRRSTRGAPRCARSSRAPASGEAGRTAARRSSSSTRSTASTRPSRTRCCPRSRRGC